MSLRKKKQKSFYSGFGVITAHIIKYIDNFVVFRDDLILVYRHFLNIELNINVQKTIFLHYSKHRNFFIINISKYTNTVEF